MKRMTAAVLAALLILCALCACGAEPTFVRGVTDMTHYTNETFGISFSKRGGWTFYSDEQLAEMKSLSVSGTDYDAALTKAGKKGSVVDMAAINEQNGDCISIAYENLKASGKTGISDEDYMTAVREDLEKTYKGFYVVPIALGETTLGGETYYSMTVDISSDNVHMVQYFYIRRVQDYMVLISGTALSDVSDQFFPKMFS